MRRNFSAAAVPVGAWNGGACDAGGAGVARGEFPGAKIVVASSGLAAQVWEGNPFVDRLALVPNPLREFGAAVKALRRLHVFHGEPYTTLLTTGNERTKLTLASVLSGYSRRVGFAVHTELLHTPVRYDPVLSQIANNLRLLPAAGLALPAGFAGEPTIDAAAQQAYAEGLLGPRAALRIALVTQTSVTQRKGWRRERWVELVRVLARAVGCGVRADRHEA